MTKHKHKKVSRDPDEELEGVSYEKGHEFEISFAAFMKSELSWPKVRVGAHLSGKQNQKGASIDVIGERLDEIGIKCKNFASTWTAISLIFGLFSAIYYVEKWGQHGIWFLILALVSMIGSIIFRIISDIFNKQNSWVECKNLKGKANINHISKMLREIQDHKASKNDSHRFTHFYFASANGYVENALKLATDNKIMCYVKEGNRFTEVKYWS